MIWKDGLINLELNTSEVFTAEMHYQIKYTKKKECGIINLDDIKGEGTHWVCYRNLEKNLVEYFDPFGLIMPYEIHDYLLTSGKKIIYSQEKYKIEKLFYVVIGVCII